MLACSKSQRHGNETRLYFRKPNVKGGIRDDKAEKEEGAGGKAQKLRCLGSMHAEIQADTEQSGGVPLWWFHGTTPEGMENSFHRTTET